MRMRKTNQKNMDSKMKSNPVARANKNRPQVIPNKKKPKRNDLKSELVKDLRFSSDEFDVTKLFSESIFS